MLTDCLWSQCGELRLALRFGGVTEGQLGCVQEYIDLSDDEQRAAKVLGYSSAAAWTARDAVGMRPPEERHGGVRGTPWCELQKEHQRAAITLGYHGSGWDETQLEHKKAGEKKYAKSQREILAKREAAAIERAAAAKSALLRQRAAEEKEWRAKEDLARQVKAEVARQSAQEESVAEARAQAAAQRKEGKRRKLQQRLEREAAWEQAQEAQHLARLTVRRAAADAEMTRLDELQTSKAARKTRRLQRERAVTEARVAAALRKAAAKGTTPDYLQGNCEDTSNPAVACDC